MLAALSVPQRVREASPTDSKDGDATEDMLTPRRLRRLNFEMQRAMKEKQKAKNGYFCKVIGRYLKHLRGGRAHSIVG